MTERTLSIIKPDAVGKNQAGKVLARIEAEGFTVVGLRLVHLTRGEAEGFYAVHRERPFFNSLTEFMSSGPTVVMVLEREGAIAKLREIMGATDPAKAAPGTIRRELATNVERNVIHGSDSTESAAVEIPYFFSALDLHGR